MANLRPMLFMGLLVLSYLMWVEWQKDYGVKPQSQPVTEVANTTLDTLPVPGTSSAIYQHLTLVSLVQVRQIFHKR